MKGFKQFMALIAALSIFHSGSSLADTFLDSDKPFIAIQDENRQAEAWGTCVATYKLMSLIQKNDSPAFSKQLSDLANGATIALYMSYMSGISENGDLAARDKMGKVLMESIPDTRFTAITAAGELTNHNEEWQGSVMATLEQCHKNLETQQLMVDAWRNLYASGAYE